MHFKNRCPVVCGNQQISFWQVGENDLNYSVCGVVGGRSLWLAKENPLRIEPSQKKGETNARKRPL
jgi:hypothetical protein